MAGSSFQDNEAESGFQPGITGNVPVKGKPSPTLALICMMRRSRLSRSAPKSAISSDSGYKQSGAVTTMRRLSVSPSMISTAYCSPSSPSGIFHRLPGIRLDAPAPDPADLDPAGNAPQTRMHRRERLQGEARRLRRKAERRVIGVITPRRSDAVLPFPTELREPRCQRHHRLVEPYQRGARRQIPRCHRLAAGQSAQEMRQPIPILADQFSLRDRDDLADSVWPDERKQVVAGKGRILADGRDRARTQTSLRARSPGPNARAAPGRALYP